MDVLPIAQVRTVLGEDFNLPTPEVALALFVHDTASVTWAAEPNDAGRLAWHEQGDDTDKRYVRWNLYLDLDGRLWAHVRVISSKLPPEFRVDLFSIDSRFVDVLVEIVTERTSLDGEG
jgi:hypothetical protein